MAKGMLQELTKEVTFFFMFSVVLYNLACSQTNLLKAIKDEHECAYLLTPTRLHQLKQVQPPMLPHAALPLVHFARRVFPMLLQIRIRLMHVRPYARSPLAHSPDALLDAHCQLYQWITRKGVAGSRAKDKAPNLVGGIATCLKDAIFALQIPYDGKPFFPFKDKTKETYTLFPLLVAMHETSVLESFKSWCKDDNGLDLEQVPASLLWQIGGLQGGWLRCLHAHDGEQVMQGSSGKPIKFPCVDKVCLPYACLCLLTLLLHSFARQAVARRAVSRRAVARRERASGEPASGEPASGEPASGERASGERVGRTRVGRTHTATHTTPHCISPAL